MLTHVNFPTFTMADPRYGGLIRPVDCKWNQPAFWQSSAGRLNTAEATTDSGHSVSAATIFMTTTCSQQHIYHNQLTIIQRLHLICNETTIMPLIISICHFYPCDTMLAWVTTSYCHSCRMPWRADLAT